MTYSTTFGQSAAEADSGPQQQVLEVEFVLDSHHVTGELRYGGPPRRLVDILNSIDTGYISIYAGAVANAVRKGTAASDFRIAQVKRDAILIAIPRTENTTPGGSMESVRKVPIRSTFALPGYQLSGNMFLVPDADPVITPILASRHFIPLTDAEITPAHKGPQSRERLVVVNLACTLLYAPKTSDD